MRSRFCAPNFIACMASVNFGDKGLLQIVILLRSKVCFAGNSGQIAPNSIQTDVERPADPRDTVNAGSEFATCFGCYLTRSTNDRRQTQFGIARFKASFRLVG